MVFVLCFILLLKVTFSSAFESSTSSLVTDMFKLRIVQLTSNLLPATGLKIVGTGECLPWCSISSSFQNSVKTPGHRGYEFLENDIGFLLLKSLWSSLTYF